MRILFISLVVTALAASAPAAPISHDLGQGLVYYRVRQLPADLPAPTPDKPRALVLDLRFTVGHADTATALDAWLKSHASTAHPVLLLVNAATAPAITRVLAARESAAGLVAIGTATADFAPDIELADTSDAERRAYDALENGTAVTALISDTLSKPRHDEAELVRLRQAAAAAPGADDSLPATVTPETPPAASPLIDRALQRAVQLHRTLVALRKLPRG